MNLIQAKHLPALLALLLFPVCVYSQKQPLYTEKVADPRIKSVQLYREGWNLSYPVIKLSNQEKLVLHFDLLSDDPEIYYYTFLLCDRNWGESTAFPSDYLSGITENQIEDYKPSFGTKINYYHYKISFPNERVSLKVSGNYIVKVYRQDDPDNPLVIKRFMVTEDLAVVDAGVTRPQIAAFYNTGQQVNFTVKFPSLRVVDPYREITSSILQNGQWTTAKTNLNPDFVGSGEVRYNSLSEKNIFLAGSEFRYFDIKSIRYQSEYIRMIDFKDDIYHVFLMPSENRAGKPYFYWQDFNGKYYVAVQEGRNMDTDADYVRVYFTLPSMYELRGGRLYVWGERSNWQFELKTR
ncbi:MAG: DUF5103 domain-containing protein [Bacteroidales bacterium]